MLLPRPTSTETKSAFLERGMEHEIMKKEFPKIDHRFFVCTNLWEETQANVNWERQDDGTKENMKYYEEYKEKEKKRESNYHHHSLIVQSGADYSVERREHDGRPHIVLPVVMMVPGVHYGSHGPILHVEEELQKYTDSWNGIPVVIGHPEKDGKFVSANQPNILESEVVGRVFNVNYSNHRLRGEVWLDEEKVQKRDPEVVKYIDEKYPIDVSIGSFTEDIPTQGTWNDEEYIAVSRNYRPDHLALLPNAAGACSWKDGCGIRVNAEGRYIMGTKDFKPTQAYRTLKVLAREGYLPQSNEMGHVRRNSLIQRAIDAGDTDEMMNILVEVFDDRIVYKRVAVSDSMQEEKLFQRSYEFDAEMEKVLLGGDIMEVREKTEFIEVNQENKREVNAMGKPNKHEEVLQKKIQALVEAGIFAENDDALTALNENQVDRILGAVEKGKEMKTVETQTNETKPMDKEQALKVLKEHLKDPKEFVEMLPKDFQEQYAHGQRLLQRNRAEKISYIQANAKGVYTEDELKLKDLSELEKLSKAIKPVVDYSAGGNSDLDMTSDDDADDIMLPPDVEREIQRNKQEG